MSAQLIPLALPRWQHFQRVEARERGYKVTFVGFGPKTAALFFNGSIFCYARIYNHGFVYHAINPKESN